MVPLDLRLLTPGVGDARLQAWLVKHYAGAAHVHVMSLDESPTLTHLDPQVLNETNDMD